jgi:AcrR family transcriptional regulator
VNRRTENAEATKRAVLDAARQLFAEKGYFQAKIEDVAELARASPATVYAQCGGKRGLLQTLMEQWAADVAVWRIPDTAASIPTAEGKLEVLGEGLLGMFHRWGDIIRLAHEASPHAPEAAAQLNAADERLRNTLRAFVDQLRGTARLIDEDQDDVVMDMILYHLRYQQLTLLIDDFGWDSAAALAWILQRLQATILRPPRTP